MKVIDWDTLDSIVVHYYFSLVRGLPVVSEMTTLLRVSLIGSRSAHRLWEYWYFSVCVCVCYRLQEVRLLLCLSTFLRLEHILHLFLSVCHTHTHTHGHIYTQIIAFHHQCNNTFNGKICLLDMRHKSKYFQQEQHKLVCMCVCIFLYRVWVNKCGFIIRA